MLSKRSEEIEIMDDLDISGEVIDVTLKELDVINRLLGGNAISLSSFRVLLKKYPITSLADLGCGGGDIMMQMAKIAKSQHQEVQFLGIDANPHIVAYATGNCASWQNISFLSENIFSTDFQSKSFDVIHCCLFLHHFTEEELVTLFTRFKTQAKVAIIVNDLHRHVLAFYSIKWITRFFSKSYMVQNDASLSVARGFKRSEIISILAKAGIKDYQLKWRWAFRWQLVIELGH
jgi:ubiquinone/menaquinone biosynthesis C-methylase UbiE